MYMSDRAHYLRTHLCSNGFTSQLALSVCVCVWGQVELEDGEVVGYVSLMETGTLEADAAAMADKLKRKAGKQGKVKPLDLKVRVLYSFGADVSGFL